MAENNWFYDAVKYAVENKLFAGVSEKVFAPDKLVTREEIAVIMKHYADFKGITTNEKLDLTKFADAEQIADWARSNMEWAIGYGLFLGKENGCLDSKGNATCAEFAAILHRFFGKIE